MNTLPRHLRRQLENGVVSARDTAETAARAALMHLGIGEAEPPRHLGEPERALRRRLRAHGRQLGDSPLASPPGRAAMGERTCAGAGGARRAAGYGNSAIPCLDSLHGQSDLRMG